MKIDITQEPPADIFRNRGKYKMIVIACLILSGCGMLLAAYAILSEAQHIDKLETVAFTLFVGPVFVLSYFGEKLQAFKRLTADQEKELTDMGQKHPEIQAYCALVAMNGRQPTLGEFEACQARAEDDSPEKKPKE